MMHFGHANALRQARLLGDFLVVGVHSDKDILEHKGPTVMNEKERYEAVRACKWADEVVEAAPYNTQLSYLIKYDCDFVAHGDDIVLNSDGVDTYEEVKKAGKFKIVKRTEGISTTDLVGRMLLLTKSHHQQVDDNNISNIIPKGELKEMSQTKSYTKISHFLPTARKIVQFSDGLVEPKPSEKIIYIDGGFDLFHVGHIRALQAAKKHGDYLIVGIHTDEDINKARGQNHPVMNLHERTLGVLSCRYVNEVVIGAPWILSKEMLLSMKINVVVSGVIRTDMYSHIDDHCYKAASELGIFKQIDSTSDITTSTVIERILNNYERYDKRNKKKEQRECQFIEEQEKKRKN